ncbi:tripartite motif-containing protein 16-like [Misgurnus anguillicaudatus]|uniref:tripartite motif-containing protein 16-like n=1 Tax=Misgurnus anguillicaudatus TaxID=75329 RepID=UPI003CCF5099
MAELRVSVELDQFKCPICLELLTNPVSINCGHSFCKSCIQRKWDGDANTGVYSCPLCRQKFSSRPVFGQNVMLADMVDRMRKMSSNSASRQPAEPDDEQCYACIEKKYKAIKTCLVCLASYCEVHIKLHNELNPGNRHRVINVIGKLEDKICKNHRKLKDAYCCEDQRSVCVDCVSWKHNGHHITSIWEARHKQQEQLNNIQMKVNQRIQETENTLKTLQKAKYDFKKSSQALEKDNEKTCEELISYIRRQQFVIRNMIKEKEQKEIQRSDSIQKQLQMELVVYKNRADELKQLSCTEDHIYFLQRMSQLCAAFEFLALPNITVNASIFEDMKKSVSNMKTQVAQLCKHDIKISITDIQLIQTSAPVIRKDFQRYFQPLTLDPKTVHKNLTLSDNNSKLTWTDGDNNYTFMPERFSYLAQALCMQGLSKCSYWEVEWGGPQVYIAVAYKGVFRQGCGSQLGLGHNEKSWSLCCSPSRSYVCHNYKETDVHVKVFQRIGVYLDYAAGTLSFYNVSDTTMYLIHQIKAKFSEELYPGFWVFDGSYVRLCHFSENVAHWSIVKGIKDKSQVKCTVLSQFYLWHDYQLYH